MGKVVGKVKNLTRKKIIFDLDGTLLFISEDWKEKYQEFIDKYELELTPEELYRSIGTIEENNTDTIVDKNFFIKYMNERLPKPLTNEILEDYLNYYAEITLLHTEVIYDVLEYLSQKYELISYSDWFTENQIKRLKRYNLDKFFSKIYGWDVLPVKPSIKGIQEIIKDDNIEDFIFVGDVIKYDLDIPDSMGMATIFYNRKGINQDKYEEITNIEELKNIF